MIISLAVTPAQGTGRKARPPAEPLLGLVCYITIYTYREIT